MDRVHPKYERKSLTDCLFSFRTCTPVRMRSMCIFFGSLVVVVLGIGPGQSPFYRTGGCSFIRDLAYGFPRRPPLGSSVKMKLQEDWHRSECTPVISKSPCSRTS